MLLFGWLFDCSFVCLLSVVLCLIWVIVLFKMFFFVVALCMSVCVCVCVLVPNDLSQVYVPVCNAGIGRFSAAGAS